MAPLQTIVAFFIILDVVMLVTTMGMVLVEAPRMATGRRALGAIAREVWTLGGDARQEEGRRLDDVG